MPAFEKVPLMVKKVRVRAMVGVWSGAFSSNILHANFWKETVIFARRLMITMITYIRVQFLGLLV